MNGTDIVALIGGYRFTFTNEERLQDEIAEAFERSGVAFERERRLDGASRLDFLVGRVAVEVKVSGSPNDVARQVRRYLSHPEVDEVVLVTAIARHKLLRIPGLAVASLGLQGL